MKQLKFLILPALTICMLIGVETTSYGAENQPSKREQSTYKLWDKGPYGGMVINTDGTGTHGLETKTQDETHPMTWDSAVTSLQVNSPGWRLPTISELVFLYKHKKVIGGFNNEDYWSATEQDINSAWIQGFRLGDLDRYNKQSRLRVRAVRSF